MSVFVRVASPSASVEYTGFASITQSTNQFTSDWRFGWEFTVGASALTLVGLRCYAGDAVAQRVMVHRVSDGVAVASLDITGVVQEWASGTLVTPVTLAASTNYYVSMRRVGSTSTPHYSNPTSYAYETHITWVQSRFGYVDGGDGMGTSTSTTTRYSGSDIRYTV